MPLVTQLMHTASSFLLVVVAYGLYALCVVPFIEPGVSRSPESDLALAQQVPFDPPARRYRQRLASVFPPGSWELEDAKVLKTEQAILLLRDYQPLDGGELKIDWCTIVYSLGSDGNDERTTGANSAESPPIVMQAREAILKFSGDLDVRRGNVGRILGGRLPGPIRVTRAESRPGAGDSLRLDTESVQLRTDRVWTPHDVSIRYGGSTVTGRDLTILLQPSNGSKESDSLVGSVASGIKSIELAEVDRVHIELNTREATRQGNEASANPATADRPTDLEVTCEGPFRLDLVNQFATIEDQVDVIQLCPDGSSDKLSCQKLTARFSLKADSPSEQIEPTSATPGTALRDSNSDWQVEKIIAQGDPVEFVSPGRYGEIRCDLLEYDLIALRFSAQDHDAVSLRHGLHKIEAPSLRYEMSDDRRIGTLWAAGPGRFSGAMSDDGTRTLEAFWSEKLVLRPDKGEHLLSLIGEDSTASSGAGPASDRGCWVQSDELGRINAGGIHVWLEESTPPQTSMPPQSERPVASSFTSPNLRPTRMLAEGAVAIDSSHIRGQTNTLGIWIQRPEPSDATDLPALQNPQHSSELPRREDAAPPRSRTTQRAGVAAPPAPSADRPASPPPYVHGDRIHVLLTQHPETTTVQDVSVRGHAQVSMADGMQLSGNGIDMDRAVGLAWIDGPGNVALPMKRDLSGKPLGRPELVTIQWKQRMDFDGRAVECSGDVLARTRGQSLWTKKLKVTLNTDINFQNPELNSRDVQARFVEGIGDVYLESQLAGVGGVESIDRMFVHQFLIDLESGLCEAQGPGWIKHVGTGTMTSGLAGRQSANEVKNELEFLGVIFQDGIEGNLNDRVIRLNREVQAVYGPVNSWTDELQISPNMQLGEGMVLMNCDLLTVAQIGSGPMDKTPIDLRATGNAVVEHRDCVAYAHQVKYDQRKDLLVLEGDGRSKVKLVERGAGDSSIVARQIMYSRTHRIIRIDDGDSMQVTPRGQSPPR